MVPTDDLTGLGHAGLQGLSRALGWGAASPSMSRTDGVPGHGVGEQNK